MVFNVFFSTPEARAFLSVYLLGANTIALGGSELCCYSLTAWKSSCQWMNVNFFSRNVSWSSQYQVQTSCNGSCLERGSVSKNLPTCRHCSNEVGHMKDVSWFEKLLISRLRSFGNCFHSTHSSTVQSVLCSWESQTA